LRNTAGPEPKTSPPAPTAPAAPGRRRWLRVAGLVVGAFVVGYVLTALIFFPGWGRRAIVTIPDLRGKPFAEARRAAEDVDLHVERGSVLFHPTVRAGAVLAQSPLPGQEVTRGAAIRVTLSGGPERMPMPDVSDLAAPQAQDLLTRIGFRVRIRIVISDRPEGRVLGTVPAAGTPVSVPSVVELTLSAGPPEVVVPSVAVPDLAGLPEPAAREALRSAGLRLGSVEYDPDSSAPLGGVASQSAAPGDSVKAGTAVRITISGSPPPGAVRPDSAPATPPAPTQ